MKVTILRNPGSAWNCELTEGQTGTVDEQTGKRLVASGLAIDVSDPKPVIETVPSKPTIAEARPAEIAAPAKVTPAASEAEKPNTSPPSRRGHNTKSSKETNS